MAQKARTRARFPAASITSHTMVTIAVVVLLVALLFWTRYSGAMQAGTVKALGVLLFLVGSLMGAISRAFQRRRRNRAKLAARARVPSSPQ